MKWPSDWAPSRQVDVFLTMSREQQETFMALLPNWFCSVEELLDAVKLLAD